MPRGWRYSCPDCRLRTISSPSTPCAVDGIREPLRRRATASCPGSSSRRRRRRRSAAACRPGRGRRLREPQGPATNTAPHKSDLRCNRWRINTPLSFESQSTRAYYGAIRDERLRTRGSGLRRDTSVRSSPLGSPGGFRVPAQRSCKPEPRAAPRNTDDSKLCAVAHHVHCTASPLSRPRPGPPARARPRDRAGARPARRRQRDHRRRRRPRRPGHARRRRHGPHRRDGDPSARRQSLSARRCRAPCSSATPSASSPARPRSKSSARSSRPSSSPTRCRSAPRSTRSSAGRSRSPATQTVRSVNGLVGETNDGTLNDIRGLHVTREHVTAAITERGNRSGRGRGRRRRHRHGRIRLERRDRHVVAHRDAAERSLDRRRPRADELRRTADDRRRAGVAGSETGCCTRAASRRGGRTVPP